VYLPAAAQEPPLRVSRPSPARSQARGAPTVLFVDDDPDIRSVVSRVFGAAGYHVLVESDGERAVEMSATYEGVIDVLITDAVLPTLGGPEVAARIRDQRTGIRILFVSGYGKRGHGDDALAIEDDVAFLPKPFSAPALLAKVHALLEGV
jgi:DNA-binding response OmpR family regulator